MTDADLPELPSGAFERVDESDDSLFYQPVRLVTHIDDGAIAALSKFSKSARRPRPGSPMRPAP